VKTLASDATLRSLVARLQSLSPSSPRQWGKMTSHQMICHLSDAFLLPLGERNASMATGLFQRTVMKWGGLWVPIPWPKGLATRPEMAQDQGGTPPVEFENDRARLVKITHRFAASTEFTSTPHPIFGQMTTREWKRWGYLHADHHLRQFNG
jgi:hypothetical protein